MIIALEYIIAQLQDGKTSVAVKSHRNRRQNPGLEIIVKGGFVTWQLVGLSRGTIEEVDPDNPAATRLDIYVGRADLLARLRYFPATRARPSGEALHLTNPSGFVRKGGKKIAWRGPLAKHEINSAKMIFPDGNYVAVTVGIPYLNIDWEPAMYPLSDGRRAQVHFGIQSEWKTSMDRRRTIPDAKIVLSHKQYANVVATLRQIV